MKKGTALILMLVLLGSAAVALASAKTLGDSSVAIDTSNYSRAYKFMIVTGTEPIAARSMPQTGSAITGYAQPGEIIGCVYWWSDNKWIMTYYNNGNNCGWMHVDDLK